jgi:hypothetical protein
MLKFYVEIYAWNYVRSERQWGQSGSHRWAGWMLASTLICLHLLTAFFLVAGWPYADWGPIHLPKNLIYPCMGLFAIAAVAWLAIVRSGRGDTLVRELQTGSSDERRHCESRLLWRVALSFVVFFATLVLLGFVRDIARAKRGVTPNATSAVTTTMVPDIHP